MLKFLVGERTKLHFFVLFLKSADKQDSEMLSHHLGSLAGSKKERNEVGVLASPPIPIFYLLPSCLTCTLYSQVDSCYWAVSKHVPWNTFVGSTIRRVDILKSECVVFEETQRHIVQAHFQV